MTRPFLSFPKWYVILFYCRTCCRWLHRMTVIHFQEVFLECCKTCRLATWAIVKREKKKRVFVYCRRVFLKFETAKSVIRCPALLQGSINSRHEVGNSLSSIALCFLRYHLCISGRYGRRRNGQIQRIQGTQHCQLVAREKTKDYLLQMKFTSLIRGGTRKGTTARWRESISNAGRRGGLPSGGITMAPHPVGEAHSVWLTIYSLTKYANFKFYVFINQIHRWIKGEAVKLRRFSIFNRAKRNGRRTF